jgi:serine/threonine protein kinase/Tol biopolymer transport system component
MGSRLGPYEISSVIGAGGMGEVYRARDTKLGRDVAIKVLPLSLSSDPDRLRRFEQEARAAASLSHANVLAVFQMGTYEGAPYLVSELLEGRTLREQLKRGPMTLRKVIDCGAQIARGLAAAHEKGIVHRDLKPENLFLTKDGHVKILDFGLARLLSHHGTDDASAPTISNLTEPGATMGTVGYMSPEQVSGKTTDHRADIFAFGVVLYEMVTGKRAFKKATSAETMTAILNEDPEGISQFASKAHPALERIVQRCLEKRPEQRFQSASDLAFALETLTDSGGISAVPPAEPSRKPPRKWLPLPTLGLGLLLVAGFLVWIVANRARPAAENPLTDAHFTPLSNFTGAETNPAISPDGKFVAVVSQRSGMFDIWVLQANGSGLANLTRGRIGDARAPLRAIGFSGDGSEVWSGGTETRRVMLWPLIGGAPHNFMDEHAAEVAWSPDGSRLVYHTWDPGDPMFVADREGANPRQITRSEPGLHNHYPVWSNDGRWIYFVRGRPATREMELWRISPEGGKEEKLSHLNTDIAYPTPIDEHTLLFVAPNEDGIGPWLWAFDLATRTARRVSSGLEQYTALGSTTDGRRLAASVVNPQVSLWSVPITTRTVEEKDVQSIALPTSRAWAPRFGGGSLFYLSSRDGADGLWSYRDGQALEVWEGSNGPLRTPPAISPNGAMVAFALRRSERWQMHIMATDGTGLRPLSSDVDVRGTASWSPDGKWIVVAGSDSSGPGLFKLPVDGGSPVRIVTGPFLDPVWSPEGDLIVYCGTQVFTLTPLLAVQPDGTSVKLPDIKVQRNGERVRFLPDGTGLVYMLGDTLSEQDFWLLDVRSMQSRRLTRLSNPAAMRSFDITPEGSRIVFDRLRENSGIVLIDLATKQLRP